MTLNADRPLLILDLDETLVFAADQPVETPCDFTVGPYHVYKRPFLQQFLGTVQSAYDLAIWSSSTADYVAAMVRAILPPKISLQFQWSRLRCTHRYHPERQNTYWVKDLKKVKRLGYDLCRVLIVDDSPEKLERNNGNAVYVKPFEGDPTDQEIQHLGPYLLGLADQLDFRAVEKRGWRSQ